MLFTFGEYLGKMLDTIKGINKYNELEYNCWLFVEILYSFNADYGLYSLP